MKTVHLEVVVFDYYMIHFVFQVPTPKTTWEFV